MKSLPGKITISKPSGDGWEDYASIQIRDTLSGNTFLEIKISQLDFMKALQGLSLCDLEFETRGLQNVGKKCISENFEFPLGKVSFHKDRKKIASDKAVNLCKGTEWTPSTYFGAQNSFFERDGVTWARTYRYRFVEPTEKDVADAKAKDF